MNNNRLFISQRDIGIRVSIIIVLLILVLPVSFALTCEYKDNPLIELGVDEIEWICRTNESFCLSYVKYEDRLLQINPVPKEVEKIGIVDKYEVKDGISRVLFRKTNLRADTNFTFGVKCGDKTFEAEVRPEYKSLHIVQDQVVRTKNHIPSWIAVFIIIFILAILSGLVVRFLRNR